MADATTASSDTGFQPDRRVQHDTAAGEVQASGTETLTGSQQDYVLGAYAVINNDWGAQDLGLTIGTDYTQSATFNPDNLTTGGVELAWDYPDYQPSVGAWAYPEISWGDKLGDLGTAAYSTELDNLKGLVETYSIAIGGQTANFDIGTELWLSNKPWSQGGQPVDEVMVKVHCTQPVGPLEDGAGTTYSNPGSGVTAAVEGVHPNWGGGWTPPWTFVTIDETTDQLSGTLDFAVILRQLVAQGVVSASDYVSGLELGAEPITGGSGSLTINDFTVGETLAADAIGPFNATDFGGTDASDLVISSTNGAVVLGALNGGSKASWSQVGAIGSEWRFEGSGDLVGDGKADLLLENTSGAVDIGELGTGGQLAFTQIGGLGPEWSFVGTGDFYATGQAEFLIENTSGAVDVGSVGSNGQAAYVQVGALGSAWKFVGTGDYLGDGRSDFLIENVNGAVDVGEIVNGAAAYTQVAAIGPEWSFVGSGDLLGDGRSDFLIENTSGAVDVGEVGSNGKAAFTQVAALGPEWTFVGVGDYSGTGLDSFLIENTNGAVDTGTVVGGKAQFVQVGGLGSEWTFRG